MQLRADPRLELAIYRRIERQIANTIANRSLRPGDPLQPEGESTARPVISSSSTRKACEHLALAGGRLEDDWTAVLMEHRIDRE
jgi:DNA-binding GntR family transcriptional regulator